MLETETSFWNVFQIVDFKPTIHKYRNIESILSFKIGNKSDADMSYEYKNVQRKIITL